MRGGFRKRGKKWPILAGTGILLAVAAGGVFILKSGNMKKAAVPARVISAKAGTDTLSTTIVGSGNLQGGETQELQVPAGLVIASVDVESGDTVSTGDILATVDETALTAEIAGMQNAISGLDEQINEKAGESQSGDLTAKVAGRIKKIYVESGDSVSDVMVEKGALMLLSVDGKMAVQIETESEIAVGSTVSVALSEGTSVSGKVELRSGGKLTVTVTDDGTAAGDAVTVSDSSGQVLGTGNLTIHQPLEITGTSGTVSEVCAEENQWVEADDVLLTLTDVPVSAEYQKLLSARIAYKNRLQKLLTMTDDCAIMASVDGVIESVELTEGETTTASSGNSQNGENASADESGSSIPASGMAYTGESMAGKPKLSGLVLLGSENSLAGQWDESAEADMGENVGEQMLDLENQETEQNTNTRENTTDTQESQKEGTQNSTGPQGTGETQANAQYELNEEVQADDDSRQKESAGLNQADEETQTQTGSQMNTETQAASLSSAVSAETESDNDTGSGSSVDLSEIQALQEQVTAFSISGQENMVISIEVDELDILSVQEGQEAQVTLDALEGRTFPGTVTQVSDRTSGSDGSAKYTVEVTVEKDESMRVGMSASATIVTEKKENVVAVPAEAVQEQGHRVFVYTQYDSEKDVLSGNREVQTGMSDGDKVEITSGLAEGDIVYYQKKESSSDGEESRSIPAGGIFGEMGQEGGFGGGMPGGSEQPDGNGMPGGHEGRRE